VRLDDRRQRAALAQRGDVAGRADGAYHGRMAPVAQRPAAPIWDALTRPSATSFAGAPLEAAPRGRGDAEAAAPAEVERWRWARRRGTPSPYPLPTTDSRPLRSPRGDALGAPAF